MKKLKRRIKIKKEKVILTDILPYETPVTFSNKHFYRFLIKHQVQIDDGKICWRGNNHCLELIIRLLFGFNKNKTITCNKIKINSREKKDVWTIPFTYRILHKADDFRELAIIHPKNQLAMIEFYDKYKELILYYSNISPFSIRKPHRIAKCTYYEDKTHIKDLAYDHEYKSAEEFDKEYENLKTYFAYKEISNVYKFYESYQYHRCEKKYDKLFKFDISKCFSSIYSHSITWALLNKDIVKDKLSESRGTFSGKFDVIMQNLNYGETNGIIIGPEFSRIFAELILQKIDFNVMQHLRDNKDSKNKGLDFKTDYEIFRYVDDYFVFFNKEEDRIRIMDAYRFYLMEYKLYVNDSKSVLFEKPIITDITIAKQKISDLLNEALVYKRIEEKNQKDTENNEEEEKQYVFYVSSNKLITQYKMILKETGIEYKDILNYTLACLDRKVLKLIKNYSEDKDKKYQAKVVKYIWELLDFTFFIYSVYPRVNTTIKLCITLSKLIKLAKKKGNYNNDNQHIILKKIYDEISLVLQKIKNVEHTQIETLYLLITLKELGHEYRLDELILCKYLGIDLKNNIFKYSLNYFSITVTLFYIENISSYNNLKNLLKSHIKNKFKRNNKFQMAELTFLLFDILSCPWLDRSFKKDLLCLYDIINNVDQEEIIESEENWFTTWTNFDFLRQLELKKSQEVY